MGKKSNKGLASKMYNYCKLQVNNKIKTTLILEWAKASTHLFFFLSFVFLCPKDTITYPKFIIIYMYAFFQEFNNFSDKFSL